MTTSDFWSSVREALRGTRQDFTEVPIRRAILLLAVPMILEMAMESLFVIVDIFWVSRLGAEAVASVGLTEAMFTLVYTVAVGLSIGATATVARRIGEKDPERAARSAVQVIVLGFAVAIPLGVAGALLAPRLLGLMGASAEVIERGEGYTAVMFGGNATVLLLFLGNAIFRGAGDAAIAMRVLWLANGLNILLGPCFIFGLGPFPELGVTGAAVATNIGRGTGVVYLLFRLWRGGAHIRVQRRHLRIETHTLATLVRLSATGMLQSLIGMSSWLALIRILSGFGSAVLAGYTIGVRIIIFALLPSWGLGNAAATMVGQNLDYTALLKQRAEKQGVDLRFVGTRIGHTRRQSPEGKHYSLWDCYVHADVVTYPSWWEGWGNQFIEAIFAMLPVVLFEYPVYISDLKGDGFKTVSLGHTLAGRDSSGLETIDKAHIAAAAKELVVLLQNKQSRQKMVETNYAIAREKYSYQALLEIIKGLLAKAGV